MRRLYLFHFLLLVILSGMASAQSRPALVLPTGHSGGVAALRLSPTGTILYSLGMDGQLKSWDLATGKTLRSLQVFKGVFKAHEEASLDISPSGKQALVALSTMGECWLIDLISFRVVKLLPHSIIGTIGVFFSADELSCYRAATWGIEHRDIAGNTDKKWFNVTADEMLAGRPFLTAAAMSQDRKLIAVATTSVKTGRDSANMIKLMDIANGRERSQFLLTSFDVHHLVFSRDGSMLAATDARKITLINLKTGVVQSRDAYGLGVPEFDDQRQELVVCTDGGYIGTFKTDDIASSDWRLDDERETIPTALAFHRSAGMFIEGLKQDGSNGAVTGNIEERDFARQKTFRQFSAETAVVNTAAFNTGSTALLCGSADGLARVWDLANGGLTHSLDVAPGGPFIKHGFYFKQIVYAADNTMVMANTSGGVMLLSGDLNTSLKITTDAADAALFLPGEKIAAMNIFDEFTAFDVTDLPLSAKRYWRFPVERPFVSAQTTYDKKLLLTKRDGLIVKQLPAGYTLNSFDFGAEPINASALLPMPGLMLLAGGFTDGHFRVVDYQTGKTVYEAKPASRPLTDVKYAPVHQLAAFTSEDLTASLWDFSNPQNPAMLARLKGHTDKVLSCNFSPDEKLLVTTSEDGTAKIWDAQAGNELVTLIAIGGEWMMVTPDGYYFASAKGARLVHFVKNNKIYNFEQYDVIFNRPDIVLSRLGVAGKETIDRYRKAYETRLQNMDLKSAQLNPEFSGAPEISIAGGEKLPLVTEKAQLELLVHLKTSQATLKLLNVSINGVPVFGRKGRPLPPGSKELTSSLRLELAPGANQIRIDVIDNTGIKSDDAAITVFLRSEQKPTLYVIAVGLSAYRDSRMNLHYAAKDASDIAARLGKLDKGLQATKISALVDSQATLKNIIALKTKLMQSKPGDRVVLFFAGHGQIVKEKYYLSCFDQNFDAPQQHGLSYADFENLLDGIPARQKIMFLDACQSGDFDKGAVSGSAAPKEYGKQLMRSAKGESVDPVSNNSFGLMKVLFNDLRSSVGASVIASASAAEYAIEDEQQKNGLFTYALLGGLENKAADEDKDGRVMLSELIRYAQLIVGRLSSQRQTPAYRTENIAEDFQVD